MAGEINRAFMRLSKRAETHARQTLIDTFVDAGPLTTLLTTSDHQIMYGRRGTGKTHALQFVANHAQADGNCAVYIDLRNIGSNTGIYADPTIPLPERATRLLIDVMLALHDGLLEFAVSDSEGLELHRAGPILDDLADGVTEVKVVGTVEGSRSKTLSADAKDRNRTALSATTGVGSRLGASIGKESTRSASAEQTITKREAGTEVHYVQFGRIGSALRRLATLWAPRQIWVFLDEWSSVPYDLQPYLADLLRRSALSVTGLVVKIAAIEGRVNFRLPTDRSDYIGIEVGADMTANVNLDDFMVFDNDADRAKQFFRDLLYRHLLSMDDGKAVVGIPNARELVRRAFTQVPAFEEFVTASEGVPRDAMNILANAATRAVDQSIGVDHIRVAGRQWYHRDKQPAVSANAEAQELLHWIVDEVIKHRRARAFLLNSSVYDPVIENLYDERVLHILKRAISSHDQPGVRYNVYKLDYGCYVDLLTTQQAPHGLLPSEDEDGQAGYVQVPPDDYRSIRRAILDLRDFRAAKSQ